MLPAPRIAEIVELLDRRFGLEALLLFGSEAREQTHAGSDVDLAALFRSPPGAVELLEAKADLERRIGRSVDLALASPILARRIVLEGRCLHGARSHALAALIAMLPSRYSDLKRVRAAAEAALVDRTRRARP